MRCLLAAKALAAALVLVPIHAGLKSPAFAVEIESDVTSASTTAARSGEAQQDAALDAVKPAPSAGFSGSDADSNADTDAASVPPSSAGTAVLSADAICQALGLSAWKNNLPLNFFTRLIWQESRFNPLSVSHAGAQGIAQFMPTTARRVGLADPFDPIQALPKSAALLRDLRAQFGNLGLAAAAYNAGPKRVEDWLAKRKILPQETENYVRIITGRSAQEWTAADSGVRDVALAAPAPCTQLAKVPHRAPPIIVAQLPARPARAMIAGHRPDRGVAAAIQGTPAHGVKLTQLASNIPAPKSIIAAPKSTIAAPKSIIAIPKSTIATPKSIIAIPKSAHARAPLIGSPSARRTTAEASRASSSGHGSTAEASRVSSGRGSSAEASHALRRDPPAAPHRRSAPSPRAARLA